MHTSPLQSEQATTFSPTHISFPYITQREITSDSFSTDKTSLNFSNFYPTNLNQVEEKTVITFPNSSSVFSSSGYTRLASTHRNHVGFFLLGLLNTLSFVIFLSSAEELLTGWSGVVLLASIVPSLFVKCLTPFLSSSQSFGPKILVTSFVSFLAFKFVIWSVNPWLKVFGLILASMGAGLGESSLLALTCHYPKTVINMWNSGTGAAGIVGSFVYLILTEWAKFSSNNTLLLLSPFPFLMYFCYAFILTHDKEEKKQFDLMEEEKNITKSKSILEEKKDFSERLDLKQQVTLIKSLVFRYAIPVSCVFFFQYMINQGISPTIAFPEQGWSAASAYKYYYFLYRCGVFIGRSSSRLMPIKLLWPLAVVQMINFTLLFMISYYHLVGHISVVFLQIFFVGLVGGCCYANCMVLVANETEDQKKTEFLLGFISAFNDIGITMSAVFSLFLEPFLMEHNHIVH